MSAKIKISLEDPEIKEVWETALEARREVASWPAWMRGEEVVTSTNDAPAPTTTTKTTKETKR